MPRLLHQCLLTLLALLLFDLLEDDHRAAIGQVGLRIDLQLAEVGAQFCEVKVEELEGREHDDLRREESEVAFHVGCEGIIDCQPVVLRVLGLIQDDVLCLKRAQIVLDIIAEVDVELGVLLPRHRRWCRDSCQCIQLLNLGVEVEVSTELGESTLVLRLKCLQLNIGGKLDRSWLRMPGNQQVALFIQLSYTSDSLIEIMVVPSRRFHIAREDLLPCLTVVLLFNLSAREGIRASCIESSCPFDEQNLEVQFVAGLERAYQKNGR